MLIQISERLKPFTHLPGFPLILPGSSFQLRIFPTLIVVHDLSKEIPEELANITVRVQGPVEKFTVIQNLEKGCIEVSGHSVNGYFRFTIFAKPLGSGVVIIQEKSPESLPLKFDSSWQGLNVNPSPKMEIYKPLITPRLSLGNHKAQDWEMIRRRRNMVEILPIWFKLGCLVPFYSVSNGLIDEAKLAISSGDPNKALERLYWLFLSGFSGGLSPRFNDGDHQGIYADSMRGDSSLGILSEGAKIILALFHSYQQGEISILPSLPTQFHCGRWIGLPCGQLGEMDFEWTKKTIRRVVFKPRTSTTVVFNFHKEIRRFRMRTSSEVKGHEYKAGCPIEVHTSQNYWFDNFER